MTSPVLVCHRGASALAPENSLEAFRVAMEHGMDYSELDVHVSRAGDLVVTHDPVPDPDAERALPRLIDVFDLVRGRMGIYVELKGDSTGAALADLLRGGAARDVPLMSGSARIELVEELRKCAPDVPRSILFTAGWGTEAMIAACHQFGCIYAHPCFRPVDAPMVDAIHAAGLQVMTPHTNEPEEAREFAHIGVDVIASDDPRILLKLRD
jgi:glycerophosphoryl diester phosphodiesterase